MTSVTSPQQTGRSGADIPGPRGGQGVRLLVLGTDSDAQELRDQALAAGYELAQRYSARVSHVAYGSGIDPGDARYARIRDAGLPIVPIRACAYELGLGAGESAGAAREHGEDQWHGERPEPEPEPEGKKVLVPKVPLVPAQERDLDRVAVATSEGDSILHGERGREADAAELGSGSGADGHVAGDEGAVEVESRSDATADDGQGRLEFSAFDPLTESATGLVPGFDVDFCSDVAEADAEGDVGGEVVAAGSAAVDVGAEVDVQADEVDAQVAAGAGAGADVDVDVDAAESETDYELPLGAAVIGVDPWLGDTDITGFIPVIGPETARPEGLRTEGLRPETARADEVVGAAASAGGAAVGAAKTGAVKAGAATEVAGVAATGEAVSDATAATTTTASTASTATADATVAESQSSGRGPTRRFLLSLAWALVPFASFGLLTPATFGYAAFRLRSRTLAVAALGYTLVVVLAFALSAARPPSATPGDATGTLLTLALAAAWIGGTVHALSLRAKVFAS